MPNGMLKIIPVPPLPESWVGFWSNTYSLWLKSGISLFYIHDTNLDLDHYIYVRVYPQFAVGETVRKATLNWKKNFLLNS